MNSRKRQDGCIISDDEIEMALHRTMHDQLGRVEPSSQAWQKLRTNIIASKPINPQEEITPRLLTVRLAWLNMFVPRMLQATLVLVLMFATLLTGGAELGGFAQRNSHPATPIVIDSNNIPDPQVRNDPAITRALTEEIAARQAMPSNAVDEAERVRPQIYLAVDSNGRAVLKNGEYVIR